MLMSKLWSNHQQGSFSLSLADASIIDHSKNIYQPNSQSEISLIIDSILLDLKTSNLYSAQANLDKSAEYIYLHPGAVDEWSQKLEATLTSSQIVQLDFTDDLLIYELQSENCGVINACINAWYDKFDFDRLSMLARSITSKSGSLISIQAGYICERLACIISIYSATDASKLSSVAMKLLAQQIFYTEFESEKLIEIGRIFTELPDTDRVFWHRAVNAEVKDEEWNASEINERFKTLNSLAYITYETIPIVRQFVPAQHRINVRIILKDKSAPNTISLNSSATNTYSYHDDPSSAGGRRKNDYSENQKSFPTWAIVICFVLLGKLGMFISKDEPKDKIQPILINEKSLNPNDKRLINADDLLKKYRKEQNEKLDQIRKEQNEAHPFGEDINTKPTEFLKPSIPEPGRLELPE
jgi:hypothetical protein